MCEEPVGYSTCAHAGRWCLSSARHPVIEEDQGSAGLGYTHKEQGAFMHFLDPLTLVPFAFPSPCHDSMINHQTHNRRAYVPLAMTSSLRPVHPNKD